MVEQVHGQVRVGGVDGGDFDEERCKHESAHRGDVMTHVTGVVGLGFQSDSITDNRAHFPLLPTCFGRHILGEH